MNIQQQIEQAEAEALAAVKKLADLKEQSAKNHIVNAEKEVSSGGESC